MSLLLVTAIMFGMMGLLLSPSTDQELAMLGRVMLVSGFVFAWLTYAIAVVR